MADDPSNHTLELLRRMDAKLDRIIDDVGDLKVRVTSLEENYAAMNRRLDRMERDMHQVKRRLDLVEA
jgi:hypothetical protein